MDGPLSKFRPEDCQKLYQLMDYEKKDIVEESIFLAVMRPWAAFSACDINNDDELDTKEMERLFWLTEGKRPLISRVQHEMVQIDED